MQQQQANKAAPLLAPASSALVPPQMNVSFLARSFRRLSECAYDYAFGNKTCISLRMTNTHERFLRRHPTTKKKIISKLV
jgi:hypothetical protein